VPPSCAVWGGFAIGAQVLLLWQHKRLMQNVSEYSLYGWLTLANILISKVDNAAIPEHIERDPREACVHRGS